MKTKRIDHIGIAVENIAAARTVYEELLGMEFQPLEEVASQQVTVAKGTVGESHVELLEATAPESPLARFIAEKGPGLHHICLAVDDIDTALARFRDAGYALIDQQPRPGADGKLVAFLHPRTLSGVLLELSQD